MTSRQTDWPREWLMTDDRMGERLWSAIDGLREGQAGIVVRHYRLDTAGRGELARRIAGICRERGLTLAVAADVELARTLGAELVHNPPGPPSGLPFSRSVHSLDEAEAARREGAALVFVAPVYPTSSHPGRRALGVSRARRIAEAAGVPAIALGGMDALKFARLEREGFYGWAGIDAWLRI